MALQPFQDGFPIDPQAAIEASYFLSDSEKQEWREWLQTATNDQRDELVEILHSMWQEHQKNSVPEQFQQGQASPQTFPGLEPNAGTQNPPANPSFSLNQSPQSNQSTPYPTPQTDNYPNPNQPPSFQTAAPAATSAPSLPNVGQASPVGASDPFTMQPATGFNQSTPNFGNQASTGDFSIPSQVSNPDPTPTPAAMAPVNNFDPANANSPTNTPSYPKDPFSTTNPQPQPVANSATSSSQAQTSDSQTSLEKELEEFNKKFPVGGSQTPAPTTQSTTATATKPDDQAKPKDKTQNDPFKAPNTPSKSSQESKPKMNIDDLTKQMSYKPNPLIQEAKKTDQNSSAKGTNSTKSKVSSSDLDVLEGMYHDYIQTQDDNQRKFADFLKSVTEKMSGYGTLQSDFSKLNDKFLKLNSNIQTQAKSTQRLQNQTQARGNTPLQTQIDDLRSELETTQKQVRDFHSELRKNMNALLERFAEVEVDSYGAAGVTTKLSSLQDKVSRLEQKWSQKNTTTTSPTSQKSNSKKSSNAPSNKNQTEQTPTKSSQFDLRGIM
jgi:polyhydroxyalkanoate synthesis regulator phasin